MRFVQPTEFDYLNEQHRKSGHKITYESTHPDSTGKFVKQAIITYKYRTPKSQATFSKVIDEYCTFDYANIIDI
ncbi:MAG: hypothetical protein V4547_18275 [Bacteroidota bacterium]